MRYGSVTVSGANSLISRVVQSAMPTDLAARVNAAIAALPAGYVVVGLTLAGAGQGHTFTVEIEAGLLADVSGGFQAAAPQVTCFLASEAEALLLARIQASPAIGQVFADTQVAGASDGTRFMGMVVRGIVAPDSGIVQYGFDEVIELVQLPSTQAAIGVELPRNGAADPLRVVLPGVRPGNYLRVMWTAVGQFTPGAPGLSGDFGVYPIVTFDGSTAFPGTFSFIDNTQGTLQYKAETGSKIRAAARHGLVAIPAGATTATVELLYNFIPDGDLEVRFVGRGVAVDPEGFPATGASLEASEITRASVAASAYPLAPGFNSLLPLVP